MPVKHSLFKVLLCYLQLFLTITQSWQLLLRSLLQVDLSSDQLHALATCFSLFSASPVVYSYTLYKEYITELVTGMIMKFYKSYKEDTSDHNHSLHAELWQEWPLLKSSYSKTVIGLRCFYFLWSSLKLFMLKRNHPKQSRMTLSHHNSIVHDNGLLLVIHKVHLSSIFPDCFPNQFAM